MADVLRPVESIAERAPDVSVIDQTAVMRFPAGQAAEDGKLVRSARDGDPSAFSRLYERYGRVVECRFYGGLSVEETAEALGTSPATVKRDWTIARAWLNRELDDG